MAKKLQNKDKNIVALKERINEVKKITSEKYSALKEKYDRCKEEIIEL